MNKFLKKENKFLKQEKENKFLKKDVQENKDVGRKEFVEELSSFMAHYLMGNPEKALEEMSKLSPEKHLFIKRSLTEEVGEIGFGKMYNKTKYRVALALKQCIRDIDNFIP